MWMVFSRAPRAEVPVWPGRRALGVVDALLWPALALLLMTQLDVSTGVVGKVAISGLVIALAHRAYTAVLMNGRYRFTTARLATVLLWAVAFGILLAVADRGQRRRREAKDEFSRGVHASQSTAALLRRWR